MITITNNSEIRTGVRLTLSGEVYDFILGAKETRQFNEGVFSDIEAHTYPLERDNSTGQVMINCSGTLIPWVPAS